MNLAQTAAPFLILLLWLAIWVVGLYLALRFLRAVERGAGALERLADATARQATDPGPRGRASMGVPPNER